MPSTTLDEIQTVISAAADADFRGADWPRLKRALDGLEDMLLEPDSPDARRARNYARLLGQRTAASFMAAVDDRRQTTTDAVQCLFTFVECLRGRGMCDQGSYDTMKVEFFGYMDGQGLLQG